MVEYLYARLVDEGGTGSRHTPGFPSGFKEMRAGHPAVANRNRRHRSSVFYLTRILVFDIIVL